MVKINPIVCKGCFIQMVCVQQLLAVIYSASVVDSAIEFYFLLKHEKCEYYRKWQVSIVLFLSTL